VAHQTRARRAVRPEHGRFGRDRVIEAEQNSDLYAVFCSIMDGDGSHRV
jgi:hypothetical protein